MLDPSRRSLLTDALTPPVGMRFDAGLATTYSLDPTALLTVPIHLAWLASAHDNDLLEDPIRLLEAARRVASRFTVFCQRGQIQVPTSASALYGLLEQMLYESAAPAGGSLHAKMWLLRYVGDTKPSSRLLRLIVQSRNLTFDRSWDVSLKLEGQPGEVHRRQNGPLCKFCRALCSRTEGSKPMPPVRSGWMAGLIEDAWATDWELPEGFDELRFHAIGLDGKPWLPDSSHELAIISPFVSATALQRLAETTGRPRLLVARSEQLDVIPAGVRGRFERTRILSEQAATGDAEDGAVRSESGLHAKVYVQQCGWGGSETRILIGSANATNRVVTPGIAARNLELMAELVGRRAKVGSIEDLFADGGLADLLAEYCPPAGKEPDVGSNPDEQKLERARGELANAGWCIQCARNETDWSLTLRALTDVDLDTVDVRVWPLSISQEHAVLLSLDAWPQPTELGVVATAEVTALLGFHLTVGACELRFATEAHIEGLPDDRDSAIDRLIIGNRQAFIRYLLLLLGSFDPDASLDGAAGEGWWRAQFGNCDDDPPLFDLLARAYARDPARMQPIVRLVRRLAADGANKVVPEDFRRVWQVFEQALKQEEHDAESV